MASASSLITELLSDYDTIRTSMDRFESKLIRLQRQERLGLIKGLDHDHDNDNDDDDDSEPDSRDDSESERSVHFHPSYLFTLSSNLIHLITSYSILTT